MKFLIFSVFVVFFIKLNDAAFTKPSDLTQGRLDGLTAHNTYRAKHFAPNLVLEDTINDVAQSYAEYLADTGLFQHSSNGYGENLYQTCVWGSIPNAKDAIKAATDAWYDEISSYNFNNPGFSMSTGHFSAVVWKSTTKVGFGVAIGEVKYNGYTFNCAYVVANYKEPGNVLGRFAENVLKA